MKDDLRAKYLNDIDILQRSTAQDPESWSDLDKISDQIQGLNRLLQNTEQLTISDSEPTLNQELSDEISCPICFEEMLPPKQIFCCPNGHPICSNCDQKVKICPVCRQNYVKDSRRNHFAERLIIAISKGFKP